MPTALPRAALLFWGLCLACFSTFAQENSLIMGRIDHLGLVKEVEINLNERYLNNKNVVHTAAVSEEGYFVFPLTLHEPQLLTLTYSRNQTLLYLEPRDTLEIITDANSFPHAIQFEHRSGANNTHLKQYLQQNPTELNALRLKQSRSRGPYWYINAPDMDRLMLASTPKQFRHHMALRKAEALANLDSYVRSHPDALTPSYREFIRTEIIYNWAYHLLLFGDVFRNRYAIDDSFFDFLTEVPLQNGYIGNYWYRHFVQAYLVFQQARQQETPPTEVEQYQLAGTLFTDKARAFLQSEILVRGFRAKQVEALRREYWDFSDHNAYPQFDEKVARVYYQIMKYAAGELAPDFVLTDPNDRPVSLHQYQGQVVYLNFWASWCRPCMAKLEQLRAIQGRLEEAGVVFLHVSLDRDRSTWLETLTHRDLRGVQVWANGDVESEVAQDYEIKILPQYYLIDKRGNFAAKPRDHDLIEIESVLLRLNASSP
ncbi:MAG: TlpA disulfide reductase family protein [Bacteroidota bacterium]